MKQNDSIKEIQRAFLKDPYVKNYSLGLFKFDRKKYETDTNIRTELLKQYFGIDVVKATCSGIFGEKVAECILSLLGKIPKRKIYRIYKRLEPDFTCIDGIWEVKSRCYTMSGSAGNKIFSCCVDYGEIVLKTKLPLFVLLLGYQEIEADKKWDVFENGGITKVKVGGKKYLQTFIRGSDLYKSLNL